MRVFTQGLSLVVFLSVGLSAACTVETEPAAPAGPPATGGSSAAGTTGVLPAASGAAAGGSAASSGGSGGAAPTAGTGSSAAGSSAGGQVGAGGTGTTGSGGSSSSGGSSPGGLAHGPTAGCGKQVADEPQKDVLHNIMVNGVARRYWTKLPTTYTPDTQQPLVFYGPGCGASGVEGAPLDNSIRMSAIRVFVIGTGSCFSTGGPEPETGYFNAVLDEVQANYCTDKGKVFLSGYSSGAWLSMLLACTAGDRITAIGTAAGGFKANHPLCKGNPAAMFHAGTGDTANPITKLNGDGINEGSAGARDRMIMDNGCTQETKVWDPAFPYCKEYIGCKSPVVWCEQNVGHSNGEEVARTGWWKFWSALP